MPPSAHRTPQCRRDIRARSMHGSPYQQDRLASVVRASACQFVALAPGFRWRLHLLVPSRQWPDRLHKRAIACGLESYMPLDAGIGALLTCHWTDCGRSILNGDLNPVGSALVERPLLDRPMGPLWVGCSEPSVLAIYHRPLLLRIPWDFGPIQHLATAKETGVAPATATATATTAKHPCTIAAPDLRGVHTHCDVAIARRGW